MIASTPHLNAGQDLILWCVLAVCAAAVAIAFLWAASR